MYPHSHALYQLATKALLFDGNKILVLITPDGYLDFPGGRVDETERDVPWTESLKREVAEELGVSIVIKVVKNLFVSKRQYREDNMTHFIAAIFFECHYLSGNITLSNEHRNFEWMTPGEILSSRFKFISDDERSQLSLLFA